VALSIDSTANFPRKYWLALGSPRVFIIVPIVPIRDFASRGAPNPLVGTNIFQRPIEVPDPVWQADDKKGAMVSPLF
jgi:hypothetical protein